MEPSEFTNPANTVFRYDQVITQADLQDAIEMLTDVYNCTSDFTERDRIEVAIATLNTMLDWIMEGKPVDFGGMI